MFTLFKKLIIKKKNLEGNSDFCPFELGNFIIGMYLSEVPYVLFSMSEEIMYCELHC